LRLVVSGKNQLSVYCTPFDSEIDDVLFPMAWVMNITLDRGPDGFIEQERRWLRLPLFIAAETTLYQWQGAERWRNRDAPFEDFTIKQNIMKVCRESKAHMTLFEPMSAEVWDVIYAQWKVMRDHMNSHKRDRKVHNPNCYVPMGLEYDRSDKRMLIIAIGTHSPEAWLYRNAPDKERKKKVAEEYAQRFNLYSSHLEGIKERAKKNTLNLVRLSLSDLPEANGFKTDGIYSGWGGWESIHLEKLDFHVRKAIKEQQERGTYNADFNKVYWFPTLGIDTTDDKPKKE
jgi:hypothetical protein